MATKAKASTGVKKAATKVASEAAKKKTAPKPAAASAAKAPAKKTTAKKPAAAKAARHAKAGIGADRRRHYVEVAAYFMAERRGFMGGCEHEDWLAAESEIDRLLKEGKLNS